MKRCPFNMLAVVSLVLCVALILAWVRSELVPDELDYFRFTQSKPSSTRLWTLQSDDGVLFTRLDTTEFNAVGLAYDLSIQPFPLNGWSYSRPFRVKYILDVKSFAKDLGFEFEMVNGTNMYHRTYSSHAISVPYWLLVSLTALLPFDAIRTRLRRVEPNHCVRCNYDLRATPDRCPECGEAPKKTEKLSV
jgi:hypothetical protein